DLPGVGRDRPFLVADRLAADRRARVANEPAVAAAEVQPARLGAQVDEPPDDLDDARPFVAPDRAIGVRELEVIVHGRVRAPPFVVSGVVDRRVVQPRILDEREAAALAADQPERPLRQVAGLFTEEIGRALADLAGHYLSHQAMPRSRPV